MTRLRKSGSRIVLYAVVPYILYLVLAERMSWQPRTLGATSTFFQSLAFSPVDHTLAIISVDNEVQLWDTERHRLQRTLKGSSEDRGTRNVAFSLDGRMIATTRVWDVQTGQLLFQASAILDSVAFSPDGKTIVSGGAWVHIWDSRSGRLLKEFGDDGYVNSMAFSPDGRVLATGGSESPLTVWVVQTGKKLRCLDDSNDSIGTMCFSPDGSTLALSKAGLSQNQVELWNTQTWHKQHVLTGGDPSAHPSVAFSPDGHILAYANEKQVILWNVERQQEERVLTGFAHAVKALSFSADGKMLATGTEGGVVQLWRIK